MAPRVLSPEQLAALQHYQYNHTDLSFISQRVLKPLWKKLVQFLPTSVAPNVVTLIGFACTLTIHVLMWWYAPNLSGEAPTWAYVLCGLGIFAYMVLDNLDGQQARRTGTSSPLGELFDHGVDSLVCTVSGLTIASVMRLGERNTFLSLLSVFVVFYGATWEQHITKCMFFGPINGPCEGILLLVTVCLVTAAAGPAFWLDQAFGSALQWNELMLVLSGLAAIPSLWGNYVNVRVKIAEDNLSLKHVMRPWVSPMLLFVLSATWYQANAFEVTEAHPRLFYWVIGTSFSFMAAQTTLFYLVHSELPVVSWGVLPSAVGMLNACVGALSSGVMVTLLFFLTVGSVGAYYVFVARDIAHHLNIDILRIPVTPAHEVGAVSTPILEHGKTSAADGGTQFTNVYVESNGAAGSNSGDIEMGAVDA